MRLDAIVDARAITLKRNGREILRGIDWLFRPGEHWAVIGANGSGKTTFLQIVGGCMFPTSGEIDVLGCRFGRTDLFQLRRRVGWISSALQARMPGHETLQQIVISGLRATFGLVYEYTAADAAKAEEYIAMVGLAGREETPFGVLSQGEQQKTLFARSLMADPELLILDEACAGLDLRARESFLKTVGEVLGRHRTAVVMVTHHIEEIPPEVGKALLLKEGRVAAAGSTAEVFTGPVLSDAFGIDIRVNAGNGRFWASVG